MLAHLEVANLFCFCDGFIKCVVYTKILYSIAVLKIDQKSFLELQISTF